MRAAQSPGSPANAGNQRQDANPAIRLPSVSHSISRNPIAATIAMYLFSISNSVYSHSGTEADNRTRRSRCCLSGQKISVTCVSRDQAPV